MSVADGLASVNVHHLLPVGPLTIKEAYGEITLTGTLTMTAQFRNLLRLDPGGAGRTVLLPPEQPGLCYFIANAADAAESLTVKDDANGTTVVTIAQNQAAIVWCGGLTAADWKKFVLFTAPA